MRSVRSVLPVPSDSRPSVLLCYVLSFLLIGGGEGCKDLTGSPGLPSGTPNPSFYHTRAGALGMYSAAVGEFENALPQYIIDAGLLTDELEDRRTGASQGTLLILQGVSDPLDERILSEGVSGSETGADSYDNLQSVRELANQAIGALATYDTAAADTATSKIARGELYALEGYAEILLADLFCSGVPLSTLDFQKDFTYAPSSTTAQVYRAALAEFDTATTLADTSIQVLNLARVGKGRALLGLGLFDSAAAVAAEVPDEFQYQLAINWGGSENSGVQNKFNAFATVSDSEGHTGVSYRSSGDPRAAVDTEIQPNPGNGGPYIPLTFPAKYSAGLNGAGYAPFTLADWIEAHLITAEAALHNPSRWGNWLDILNGLRQTAITPALPALSDPGAALSGAAADRARVSLLFQERAYWLFVTGHRQGDLRRLIRQYDGWRQDQVYPTGPYLAPGTGVFGSDVTAPIPTAEAVNPLFHGCLNRGA